MYTSWSCALLWAKIKKFATLNTHTIQNTIYSFISQQSGSNSFKSRKYTSTSNFREIFQMPTKHPSLPSPASQLADANGLLLPATLLSKLTAHKKQIARVFFLRAGSNFRRIHSLATVTAERGSTRPESNVSWPAAPPLVCPALPPWREAPERPPSVRAPSFFPSMLCAAASLSSRGIESIERSLGGLVRQNSAVVVRRVPWVHRSSLFKNRKETICRKGVVMNVNNKAHFLLTKIRRWNLPFQRSMSHGFVCNIRVICKLAWGEEKVRFRQTSSFRDKRMRCLLPWCEELSRDQMICQFTRCFYDD